MLLTTTNSIENHSITTYLGVVSGDTIIGANIFKDILASITDIVGGRSASYECVLYEARATAFSELTESARQLGANAVVGIDFDFETVREGMLMVSVSGTAVIYK